MLIVVMVVSSSALILSIAKYGTSIQVYDQQQKDINIMFQTFTMCLILLTIVPTFLSIVMLRKKGTSRELRKKVSNRYLIYFFIYMIGVSGVVLDQFNVNYKKWLTDTLRFPDKLADAVTLIFDIIGLPLALIRFKEPFVQ